MEVITWQLGIAAMILVWYLVSPKTTVWLCIALTLFTFTALFYLPLIIIQLFTIWVTLVILRELDWRK
ncbi:MAG: hypothetical protein OXH03_09570 [Bacteroidetes bacterium]|nr:hypothetical protein [Bacteroidota bacterium]MDE2672364.1 hypothetical protein [Bacteroidota bacterium]